MRHDRAYHRFKTSVKQRRKFKYVKLYGMNYVYGYLRKGKIHCSCPMCSTKTRTLGYKASERRRLISMEDQLKEFL